jgi:chorismate dehydratase
MLARFDAAVIIGDEALFLGSGPRVIGGREVEVEKIDLGEVWTQSTGLPFVYAFWAGPIGVLTGADVATLQAARDAGLARLDEIAVDYFHAAPERQDAGVRYLRDNIKYRLGPDERAGLELFYRYAAEVGVIDGAAPLRFFDAP